MIECPECKELELVGTIFCKRCGTQLIHKSSDSISKPKTPYPPKNERSSDHIKVEDKTQPEVSQKSVKTSTDKERPTSTTKPPAVETKPAMELNERVILQVLETGQLIPIPEEDEVTVGRASAGQPIVPDIDLTLYQGLEAGVSRLHASIRIKGKEVYIMDLGSANGTRVNGEKIPPSTLYQLENLSVITLGKLNLKVLIKS